MLGEKYWAFVSRKVLSMCWLESTGHVLVGKYWACVGRKVLGMCWLESTGHVLVGKY